LSLALDENTELKLFFTSPPVQYPHSDQMLFQDDEEKRRSKIEPKKTADKNLPKFLSNSAPPPPELLSKTRAV
jgi:hypothetical protein